MVGAVLNCCSAYWWSLVDVPLQCSRDVRKKNVSKFDTFELHAYNILFFPVLMKTLGNFKF